MFLSRRAPGAEILEIFEQDAAVGKKVLHALGVGNWQVTFKDQSIGAEQRSRDFVLVLVYKGVHGVFLVFSAVFGKTIVKQGDAVCIPFWLRLCRVRTQRPADKRRGRDSP
jgi:hypothetical protein